VSLLLVVGMGISYQRNETLIEQARLRTAEVGQLARALPRGGSVLQALPLLDAARELPGGYARRDDGVPLLMRFGLYQGYKLGSGAQSLYRRLLRSTLLPHIVAD